MKKIELPEKNTWKQILQRPVIDTATLEQQVRGVLNVIKQDGDTAVFQFTRQFDGVQLSSLEVTEEEIAIGIQKVPDELKRAIKQAANNIRVFMKAEIGY